jgi:hypothetical protein
VLLAVLLAVLPASHAVAQTPDSARAHGNFYGWTEADMGYDFGRINPDFADRLRTSALPAARNEFGRNGETYFSARQTRFGLKAYFPNDGKELYTILEFDLIGSGADAGKTLPRLRHAYGALGAFGAGQYWSPFVDVDALPRIFESFGPTGISNVRNIQLRWMPQLTANTKLTLAVEKPGATGEGGNFADLIALERVELRFRTPVLVAAVRRDWPWGHVQVAGLVQHIWWDNLNDTTDVDLSGDAGGWGMTITPVINFGTQNVVRLQYLVGRGVENYVNDGTADVAPRLNPDPNRPIVGRAIPVQAFTGYVEVYDGKWGVVSGYSMQTKSNSDAQLPTAFHAARYATFTVVHYPFKNMTVAGEYQFGQRRGLENDFVFSDNRLQLSFRFAFSATFHE